MPTYLSIDRAVTRCPVPILVLLRGPGIPFALPPPARCFWPWHPNQLLRRGHGMALSSEWWGMAKGPSYPHTRDTLPTSLHTTQMEPVVSHGQHHCTLRTQQPPSAPVS